MTSTKHILIALNLPRSVAALLLFGRHVVQAMTDNPWFPTPTPTLASVTAHLDALEQQQALALGRGVGAVAARNLRRKDVQDDLSALKGHAQTIANQNPAEAVAIIESAGMAPKRYNAPQRADLVARKGDAAGEVRLRAKSLGRSGAYEWQSSSDGGLTWTALGTTTVASTMVKELTGGAVMLFRFRTTVGKSTGDWSQSVQYIVH